jgi:prefoldin alpha subunit
MSMDPQQLAMQYEQGQRQLQALQQHLGSLEQTMVDMRRAEATLSGLAGMRGEQEVLVPIGAGVHLRAKVAPDSLVIEPIGADYATDATAEVAAKKIQDRLKEVESAYQSAEQQFRLLSRQLQELTARLETLSD